MKHDAKPIVKPNEVSTFFGRRLVRLLQISKGACVLDVGTGRGASLIPAAISIGPQGSAFGIDISEDSIDFITRKIEELKLANVKVMSMNGLSMSFDSDAFDFILGGFVITDLYDQDSGLSDIRRVLKPGGQVGFYSWAYAEDAELMARMLREHEGMSVSGADSIIFDQETEESMTQMLNDAKFKDIKVLTEHISLVFGDEEEWWQEMWDIGWHHHMKEIENKGPDQFKRFKEHSFDVLQSYRDGDTYRFVESVVFGFGTK